MGDFIGSYDQLTYDDQIGTIGGGNHFLEVQRVAEIYDGQTANAWNLKKGAVVVMLHTGSLTIGHHSGLINRKICQDIYPVGLMHPDNKIYPIPESCTTQNAWNRFWSVSGNAANFGFANRLFLGFMIQEVFTQVLGGCDMQLLYDAPHNFIWKKQVDGQDYFIHRKGACCAGGCEEMEGTEFAYYGEPVMIPVLWAVRVTCSADWGIRMLSGARATAQGGKNPVGMRSKETTRHFASLWKSFMS